MGSPTGRERKEIVVLRVKHTSFHQRKGEVLLIGLAQQSRFWSAEHIDP